MECTGGTDFLLPQQMKHPFAALNALHLVYISIIPHQYLHVSPTPRDIHTLRDLWKRIRSILFPEKIFTVQIISLPRLLPIRHRFNRDSIQFDRENVRDKGLVLFSGTSRTHVLTVQLCEIIGIRSKLRSRMTMTTSDTSQSIRITWPFLIRSRIWSRRNPS